MFNYMIGVSSTPTFQERMLETLNEAAFQRDEHLLPYYHIQARILLLESLRRLEYIESVFEECSWKDSFRVTKRGMDILESNDV